MELKVNFETQVNTIYHVLHVIVLKLAEYISYVGSVIFNPSIFFTKSQFTPHLKEPELGKLIVIQCCVTKYPQI